MLITEFSDNNKMDQLMEIQKRKDELLSNNFKIFMQNEALKQKLKSIQRQNKNFLIDNLCLKLKIISNYK